MPNMVLINYYTRLISKELMTLEEVPEDVRELVDANLHGGILDNKQDDHVDDIEEVEEDFFGAITIDDLIVVVPRDCLTNNEVFSFVYKLSDIIKMDVEDPVYPNNVHLELIRIEDTVNKFSTKPEVEVNIKDDNISMNVTFPEATNFSPGDYIMRLDFKIVSVNYVDMNMTMLLYAE